MTVTFNHTIVYATDKRRSAKFLANVLGLPEPQAMWSFITVPLEHGGQELRRPTLVRCVDDGVVESDRHGDLLGCGSLKPSDIRHASDFKSTGYAPGTFRRPVSAGET